MANSDPRMWGAFAKFACEHPLFCGRPRTMRGTIAWFPFLFSFDDWKPGVFKKVVSTLYWWFPALFGAKILFCDQCDTMAFKSDFALLVYRLCRIINPVEHERILFFAPDVEMYHETPQDAGFWR